VGVDHITAEPLKIIQLFFLHPRLSNSSQSGSRRSFLTTFLVEVMLGAYLLSNSIRVHKRERESKHNTFFLFKILPPSHLGSESSGDRFSRQLYYKWREKLFSHGSTLCMYVHKVHMYVPTVYTHGRGI
jgi:hypothetical protein